MSKKRVAIIVSNGDLFTAYKTLNIAVSAAATYADVGIFFTFEGLNLIRQDYLEDIKVPKGKLEEERGFDTTKMMNLSSLMEMARENGVRFIACQSTIDFMNISSEDLIAEAEIKGGISFLEFAYDADLTLSF